jgi:hypothetical protein
MLNPWFSFPFQAARLGWETQTIVVDQLMRIAGMSTSDRKAAGTLDTKEMIPLAEDRVAVAAVPSSPVDAVAPATKSKHRQVAQKVMQIQKKRGLREKPKIAGGSNG